MIIIIDATNLVIATHRNAQIDEILEKYPGKTIRRIIDGLDIEIGTTDPTIAHPEYLEGIQPDIVTAAKTKWESLPNYIRTWTPEQVDDYIVTNVIDLASAKVVLRHMGRTLVLLRDFVRSR